MATPAAVLNESAPASEYARLEERILARDQKGAGDVLYRLMKQGCRANNALVSILEPI